MENYGFYSGSRASLERFDILLKPAIFTELSGRIRQEGICCHKRDKERETEGVSRTEGVHHGNRRTGGESVSSL